MQHSDKNISWDILYVYILFSQQIHTENCLHGFYSNQISKQLEESNPESRGFNASQDLEVRRLTA